MLFYFISKLFSKKVDYQQLLAEGAIVVDVRSKGEFSGGHIENAINMPLDQMDQYIGKLKKLDKTVITCCLSGTRSGMASSQLKSAGIKSINGGPWFLLKNKIK
jgi:rhodanese-related sulfurtransferase